MYDWRPNELARKRVAAVPVSTVTSLMLSGFDVGFGTVIEITDRRLIERVWTALGRATEARNIHGAPTSAVANVLRAVIRNANGTFREEWFRFHPARPEWCYGPEFQTALRETESYQAAAIARLVRQVAGTVTSIEVNGNTTVRVTEPRDRERLLCALQSGDRRLYAWTRSANWFLTIRLRLGEKGRHPAESPGNRGDDEDELITLLVSSAAKDAPERSAMDSALGVLWSYVERAHKPSE